ncbi:MAG: nucleotidyltransferase [Candidatus Binatia bacterium]
MKGKAAELFTVVSMSNRKMFYRDVLETLNEFKLEYLVGGGHALALYAGVSRKTKDLDLFVRPADVESALNKLAEKHYETELCHPHWLGKIFNRQDFIDLIFSSGNGVCQVDDGWFENSVAGEVLDVPVIFCPPEEMIWTKAFVMERERYDGADVAHLIRACGAHLDWRRLQERFGPHWRVLLSHLILFGFIYPSERFLVPSPVMDALVSQLQKEKGEPLSRNHVCKGTLLSRTQYRDDVERWSYEDARQLPCGPMTAEEAALWTAAGEK